MLQFFRALVCYVCLWRPWFVPRGPLPLVGFALRGYGSGCSPASFLRFLGLFFCDFRAKCTLCVCYMVSLLTNGPGGLYNVRVGVALVGFTSIRACARRGGILTSRIPVEGSSQWYQKLWGNNHCKGRSLSFQRDRYVAAMTDLGTINAKREFSVLVN